MTAPQRVGRSAWTASVARVPVDSATRLVRGQLPSFVDASGFGTVNAHELASCTCLPLVPVLAALDVLEGLGWLAMDGDDIELTVPGHLAAGT